MGVMAYPLRYALADLALALSRATEDSVEIRRTAARAAVDMIGDGAGVQLLGDDGIYEAITYQHIDDERSAPRWPPAAARSCWPAKAWSRWPARSTTSRRPCCAR